MTNSGGYKCRWKQKNSNLWIKLIKLMPNIFYLKKQTMLAKNNNKNFINRTFIIYKILIISNF